MLTLVFHSLYLLAAQNQDMEKAAFLVEKQSRLSNVFNMGEYHEASCRLDVAATLEIAKKMLTCTNTICLSADLRACFKDEEAYAYMKGNESWEKLLAFQIQN